jgi:geranylgeranyl diphosphate synthase type II
MSIEETLGRLRTLVDGELQRALIGDDTPPALAEAIRYPVQAGGKRLRPVLCLASAEAAAAHGGTTPEVACAAALPAACALELIHTYSLVHDDLPAMDDDTLRRGRPTAHVVYGQGNAVLVGDALLTRAFELLARVPQGSGDQAVRRLRVIALIARAAGAEGMIGGQSIDLEAAGKGRPGLPQAALDGEAVREMHARKTGALIRASAVSGALMAGAPERTVSAIDRYGTELGLAFQIVDDILDVEGSASQLGKTAGKDAAARKPTYPALFGLERSRQIARDCVDRAIAAVQDANLGGILPDLARWVVRRRS